jgi:hypothetical protein
MSDLLLASAVSSNKINVSYMLQQISLSRLRLRQSHEQQTWRGKGTEMSILSRATVYM